MAERLDPKDRAKINGWLRQIAFYGTPEKRYADSGFWKFARLVQTKDEHDRDNPVKSLDLDKFQYMNVVWLHMLHLNRMLMPKSRQVRMSWAAAIFSAWYVRTAPHRLVIYQSMKDDDATLMVSRGKDDPVGGRISFIEHHLPWWLKDYNIVSGKGNRVGELIYTPKLSSDQGIVIPWTGSRVIAVPQGANQVRGKVPSLYIGDEAGLWDDFRETWGAVAPAVRSGDGTSKMFALSSVYAGSQYNDAILEGLDPDEGGGVQIEYTGIPEMAEIIKGFPGERLPRGMQSFVTPSGMPVLETHYASDPDKRPETERGQRWIDEAAKDYIGGTASADWRREMEIDYYASGGLLVFSMLSDPKCKVWHAPLTPTQVIGMELKLGAGYDYGALNPSAFVVWGQAPDGRWYAIDEIYEPCHNYIDHARKIKSNKWFASRLLSAVVCDPQLSAEDQQTGRGKASMLSLFREQGLNMVPGRKGADLSLVQLLRYWWRDPQNPEAFICENCWNLKRELQRLKWQTYTGKVALNKNLPEKIVNKHNHIFDASAYYLDTRPKPPDLNVHREGRTAESIERKRREREAEERYEAYRI